MGKYLDTTKTLEPMNSMKHLWKKHQEITKIWVNHFLHHKTKYSLSIVGILLRSPQISPTLSLFSSLSLKAHTCKHQLHDCPCTTEASLPITRRDQEVPGHLQLSEWNLANESKSPAPLPWVKENSEMGLTASCRIRLRPGLKPHSCSVSSLFPALLSYRFSLEALS